MGETQSALVGALLPRRTELHTCSLFAWIRIVPLVGGVCTVPVVICLDRQAYTIVAFSISLSSLGVGVLNTVFVLPFSGCAHGCTWDARESLAHPWICT